MKAIAITKHGSPKEAFEVVNIPKPTINANEVLIKVESIGLNYADVMCRLGLYTYSPPLPAVVGYDVVGRVEQTGADVGHVSIGDRVMAFTHFGGYAEYASTMGEAVIKIDQDMPTGDALALLTQYCTAYYCAEEMIRLQESDHVLIHAAAGGVGIALIQLAQRYGCTIYGTAGSEEKIKFLKSIGVHHPINYRSTDFEDEIINLRGNKGLDVIFDSVGGAYFQPGYHLLNSGGRIVLFGSADVTGKDQEGQKEVGVLFGTYHPIQLMIASKAIIGVFMLKVYEEHPEKIRRVMQRVLKLYQKGELKPYIDKAFSIDHIAEAHEYLESRKSIGKVIVHF